MVCLLNDVKLLIFAHKPPPHHGQSYMVQLLLDALGGDAREHGRTKQRPKQKPADDLTALFDVECYHVDARYSDAIAEIGQSGWRKLFRALRFVLQALWCRFRYGALYFYYVPAAPQWTPILRDWLVLSLCRPFFSKIIYHWHAAGLGEWLLNEAKTWQRQIARLVYSKPDLSIVLRQFNRRDAEAFASRRIEVVPNGILDPCPTFFEEVLPRRLARVAVRKKLLAGEEPSAALRAAASNAPNVFRVLFISLCLREKGLFDAVEAIGLAHRQLKNSAIRVRLTVAGTFWAEAVKAEFEQRIRQADLQDGSQPLVDYRGFVSGAEKQRLLIESDCLCFPTYYGTESFGLVLVEGMAFGLPLITTNWRLIPELLPPNAPGIVEPKSPAQIASAITSYFIRDYDPALRAFFLSHYTAEKFAENMRSVLKSLLLL